VLTFPWNFPEIVTRAQGAYPSPAMYWEHWVKNSGAMVDFDWLYREFHQSCALPNEALLHKCCETKMASVVSASVERIRFHGLSIEMANLTINQKITVLDV